MLYTPALTRLLLHAYTLQYAYAYTRLLLHAHTLQHAYAYTRLLLHAYFYARLDVEVSGR